MKLGKSKSSRIVWAWRAVLFLAEAAYMLFELLAVRVIAPYFGTSLDVWTAIIGCVLLAGALGNYIGGKLCSKGWLPACALAVTSLLCCAVVPLSPAVASVAAAFPRTVAAVVSAFLLFFLPCIGAGTLPPFAMVAASEEAGSVEKSAGGMYAAATLGGLVGTFLGGFVLIPTFGMRVLMLASAGLYALLALACLALCGGIGSPRADDGKLEPVSRSVARRVLALIVLSGLCAVSGMVAYAAQPARADEMGKVSFETDTMYGTVRVFDDGDIRRMNIDGGFESGMLLGEGNESEPVFDYIKSIEGVIEPHLVADGASVLCFGGAAYQLPKHLLDYTEADVRVCEIDEGVTELAREWFALDEVSDRNPGRLSVESVDGRFYLNNERDGAYDVVVNDTFAGDTPARVLATREAAAGVKRVLKPGGIYVTNIIGDVAADKSFLRHELATLKSVFPEVRLLSPHGKCNDFAGLWCNWTVVCGDDLSNVDVPAGSKEVALPPLDDVEILTDDWCPVEAMVSGETV